MGGEEVEWNRVIAGARGLHPPAQAGEFHSTTWGPGGGRSRVI